MTRDGMSRSHKALVIFRTSQVVERFEGMKIFRYSRYLICFSNSWSHHRFERCGMLGICGQWPVFQLG